jgi:fucose permease
MCVAFFINGMGMSLLNAQCNSLLSMLHNSTAMGLAHASYGIGALIAPLISTQFARLYTDSHTATGPGSGKWALHYTVLLVVALSDLISFVVLLKGRGYDEILSEMGAPAQEHEEVELTRAAAPVPKESVAESGGTSGDEGGEGATMSRKARDNSSFAMVLKQVHVHILAAFVFIYVGLEVTIGGQ